MASGSSGLRPTVEEVRARHASIQSRIPPAQHVAPFATAAAKPEPASTTADDHAKPAVGFNDHEPAQTDDTKPTPPDPARCFICTVPFVIPASLAGTYCPIDLGPDDDDDGDDDDEEADPDWEEDGSEDGDDEDPYEYDTPDEDVSEPESEDDDNEDEDDQGKDGDQDIEPELATLADKLAAVSLSCGVDSAADELAWLTRTVSLDDPPPAVGPANVHEACLAIYARFARTRGRYPEKEKESEWRRDRPLLDHTPGPDAYDGWGSSGDAEFFFSDPVAGRNQVAFYAQFSLGMGETFDNKVEDVLELYPPGEERARIADVLAARPADEPLGASCRLLIQSSYPWAWEAAEGDRLDVEGTGTDWFGLLRAFRRGEYTRGLKNRERVWGLVEHIYQSIG